MQREEVIEHLQRARNLVAKTASWTQEAYARDRNGAAVDTSSSDAVAFCCSGALFTTAPSQGNAVQSRALLSAAIEADIEVWNDTPGRCQRDVIAAFDRALVLAKTDALNAK